MQQDTQHRTASKQPNGNALPVPEQPFLPHDSSDNATPISIPIINKPSKNACSKLFHVCSLFVDKLIVTDIVPKCLVGLLLILLLYLVIVVSYTMLCTQTFADYGAFDGFVSKVTAHLDATNWYLGILSEGYTDTLQEAYTKFMEAEFKELQGLVDYFNEGELC